MGSFVFAVSFFLFLIDIQFTSLLLLLTLQDMQMPTIGSFDLWKMGFLCFVWKAKSLEWR